MIGKSDDRKAKQSNDLPRSGLFTFVEININTLT